MEVMPEHVHLIIDANPKRGAYYVVNRIKGYTCSQGRVFQNLKESFQPYGRI
jgi:REP element-mobilizing transposase RayT